MSCQCHVMYVFRFTALVQHETELRQGAEGREVALKIELQSLQETSSRQTSEIQQRIERQTADSSVWMRERDALIARYELQLKTLSDERAAIQIQYSAQLTAKVAEMNDRFKLSIQDMENNCSQRIMKEMDGQLMRELATMQKKCSRDVEKVRADERKLTTTEVRNVYICKHTHIHTHTRIQP